MTLRLVRASRLFDVGRVDGDVMAGPSGCSEHADRAAELNACARDFGHYVRHWRYINRESGETFSFASLWEGQHEAVDQMREHPWLFLLKAGKLGFTELECAYDGWVLRFRSRNARVHLFSLDGTEAKALLKLVKFGLEHLPEYMRLPIVDDEPGGDTARQFMLRAGPDDLRTCVSYASSKEAAIAQSAQHSHVDELARMKWPKETWGSVISTVAPGGTVHIVTRGAGDGNYTATLYRAAEKGTGTTPLRPFFAPWWKRPRWPVIDRPNIDPKMAWYAEQSGTMTPAALRYYAPDTAEDALSGDADEAFVPVDAFDACWDKTLTTLQPGDRTPVVIGLDAGVTNDLFAVSAVSRHPARPLDPAIRAYRVWKPPGNGKELDFLAIEEWLMRLCLGGCMRGHPVRRRGHRPSQTPEQIERDGACPACADGEIVPGLNVIQICYDPTQLVDMMQRFRRNRVAWCEPFNQGTDRTEADADLRSLVIQRRLAHGEDPSAEDAPLRASVLAAGYKVAPGENNRLRIIKRNQDSKIDLLVATSMATRRCLYLDLESRSA